jgi:hypothetical protein
MSNNQNTNGEGNTNKDPMMDRKDLADYFCKTTRTVDRYVKSGSVPVHHYPSGKPYFIRSEIEKKFPK